MDPSRMDSCNSLFLDCTLENTLETADDQNIMVSSYYCSIVAAELQLKVLVLTSKALNGLGLSYLQDCLSLCNSPSSSRGLW